MHILEKELVRALEVARARREIHEAINDPGRLWYPVEIDGWEAWAPVGANAAVRQVILHLERMLVIEDVVVSMLSAQQSVCVVEPFCRLTLANNQQVRPKFITQESLG